ncbi:hypothetical protein N566_27030 [Streptomycetaceae bacterium MP113-05]|nr:hypothetical protein N566_27030 [Streptomycetaceae bacterium MP113-05]
MLRVEQLEDVAPALARQRSPRPRQIDFELIAGRLGLPGFPSDYRPLADRYPPMEIDGFLRVWLPTPGDENGFAGHLLDELETVREMTEDDLTYGFDAHPAAGGLVPWGESLHGDAFFWRVRSGRPDEWPTVVGTRTQEWWEYPGGMVAFLAGLIDGTVERRGLPEDVPRRRPGVYLFRE